MYKCVLFKLMLVVYAQKKKLLNRIKCFNNINYFKEAIKMTIRLSKLFGMDIFTTDGEYKGKVFDLVINLEKGRVETITTEALKARTKQEAKKIISEKSIPYKNVKSAKDILLVSSGREVVEEEEAKPQRTVYKYRRH